jgi:hypothetical protein
MLVKSLAVYAVFIATVLANAEPAPFKLGKMSLNQVFGLAGRQSQGYQPTQTICGEGETCPEACGANTAQCASNDGELHCFEPSAQLCCSDGSGSNLQSPPILSLDLKD